MFYFVEETMSNLYFIRHGQASFGEENYDRLSEKGAMQAEILSRHFLESNIHFDTIYRGTLDRQKGTLRGFINTFDEKNIQVPDINEMEELNEYNSRTILEAIVPTLLMEDPELESDIKNIITDQNSFQKIFEKTMLRWVSEDFDYNNIPRYTDFLKGVNRGIDEIIKNDGSGKNIAVITSGGPIAAAVQRALNLSHEDAMRVTWQIKNTSVTRFKCNDDKFMLSSFNECSHLELHGDRSIITYR